MKKILSMMLLCALILGALGSFSYINAASTASPYSGGRGTEDDPYLISNLNDLLEIRKSIEKYSALYSNKVYYKLTKDLTVSSKLSPLYVDDYLGPNCYVQTEYNLHCFDYTIEYENGCEYYTESGAEGERFSDVVSTIGPLYVMKDIYLYAPGSVIGPDMKKTEVGYKFTSFLDYVYTVDYGGFYGVEDYLHDYEIEYQGLFYRSAAFTGVFDGNGHTLNLGSNGFLFGFLENGAEIRNLNIKGSKGALAYSIDDTCTVENCTFDVGSPASITYVEDGYLSVDWEYGECEVSKDYITVAGFVIENNGNYKNCVNYGAFGDVSNCNISNFIDLSGNVDSTVSGVYSEAECLSAVGEISAFEGFDFINTWIMIDGMPQLRHAVEIEVCGDIDLNGRLDGIDANIFCRYLGGQTAGMYYYLPEAADMNGDKRLDAADSYLLKKTLSGN